MATTSALFARATLDALLEAPGIQFALLHGPASWDEPGLVVSDVDVVTDASIAHVAANWFPRLRARGLMPIVMWNYDLDATSVFVVDAQCGEGAQIDLSYSKKGRGRYGLMAASLVARSRDAAPYPRLHPVDEWLYTVWKRHAKGQEDRLSNLLIERPADEAALARRASMIFHRDVAARVSAIVRGEDGRQRSRVMELLPRADWAARRVLRPAGFWVDMASRDRDVVAQVTAGVERRVARVLPHVCSLGSTSTGRSTKSWTRALATRLRPGLVLSTGAPTAGLPIDLRMRVDGDVDSTLAEIVRVMADRHVRAGGKPSDTRR
jgi:hypothetical protein